jgi:hypothetical protein
LIYQLYRRAVDALPVSFKNTVKVKTYSIWLLPQYANLYFWRRPPVIIYQMGKVGSTSVYESLKLSRQYVIHAHLMQQYSQTPENLKTVELLMRKKSNWLYHHIIEKRHPAKIITLVRDPVAINVSLFFQNLDYWTGIPNTLETLSLEQLLEVYYSKYMRSVTNHILNWFDKQILSLLAVDVFAHSFPQEQGYGRIQGDVYDMLVLRLEIDDAVKEQCLAEFLGLEEFKLVRANIGAEKVYSEMYNAFKEAVIFPPDVLDMNYQSAFARHFYTDEQVEAFYEKWQR